MLCGTGTMPYRAMLCLAMMYLGSAAPMAAVPPGDGAAETVPTYGPGTNLADLAIKTRNYRLAVLPGELVDFEVTVWNEGPAAVVGALVDVPVPTGFGSVAWGEAGVVGALCESAVNMGDLLTTVDLAAGESVVYKVCGTVDLVPSVADLVHTATVVPPGSVNDPDTTNNVEDDIDPIGAAADVMVSVSNHDHSASSAGALAPNQQTVYEIIARNKGPSPSGMIAVTVQIPQVLGNLDFGPEQGMFDPGSGIWSGISLGPDEKVTMTVTADVLPTNNVDVVRVAAEVMPSNNLPDLFLANNASEDRDLYDVAGRVILAANFGSGDFWEWSNVVGPSLANTGVYGGEEE